MSVIVWWPLLAWFPRGNPNRFNERGQVLIYMWPPERSYLHSLSLRSPINVTTLHGAPNVDRPRESHIPWFLRIHGRNTVVHICINVHVIRVWFNYVHYSSFIVIILCYYYHLDSWYPSRLGLLHAGRHNPSSQSTIRSARHHLVVVPHYNRFTCGRHSFSVAGPMTWNSLTDSLRDPSLSTYSFRRQFKTFLFSN